MSRTLLHVVTDWPGRFSNGAATVAALVRAGADVNARFRGPYEETLLHWAASSDDVEVLDALLDDGADIDTPCCRDPGWPPLEDARAFAQRNAAAPTGRASARTTLVDGPVSGCLIVWSDPSSPSRHRPTTSIARSGAPATVDGSTVRRTCCSSAPSSPGCHRGRTSPHSTRFRGVAPTLSIARAGPSSSSGSSNVARDQRSGRGSDPGSISSAQTSTGWANSSTVRSRDPVPGCGEGGPIGPPSSGSSSSGSFGPPEIDDPGLGGNAVAGAPATPPTPNASSRTTALTARHSTRRRTGHLPLRSGT